VENKKFLKNENIEKMLDVDDSAMKIMPSTSFFQKINTPTSTAKLKRKQNPVIPRCRLRRCRSRIS